MHKNIVKAIKYEQRYNKNLKGLKKKLSFFVGRFLSRKNSAGSFEREPMVEKLTETTFTTEEIFWIRKCSGFINFRVH